MRYNIWHIVHFILLGIILGGCTVCQDPDDYFRAPDSLSKAECNKVYVFLPAPGQFVNERYEASTMEKACEYAEGRLSQKAYVSLGGFGGYLVVGFDHSIESSGGYDLAVTGNAFSGASEPGIVWVMKDSNGNGLPDDTWYELAGSEAGKPGTISNYSVTYYRPASKQSSVKWTDSLGNDGEIDYLGAFHKQDYYYPAWVTEDSYTLTGTRLEARNYDASGNGSYWVNGDFEWGYADNFSPVDMLTDDDNASASNVDNHFKISDAINPDGSAADLDYIDFVKIQTGVNAKSGRLGENSTEVIGVYDYHLLKASE